MLISGDHLKMMLVNDGSGEASQANYEYSKNFFSF